jgi:hypothetical protein
MADDPHDAVPAARPDDPIVLEQSEEEETPTVEDPGPQPDPHDAVPGARPDDPIVLEPSEEEETPTVEDPGPQPDPDYAAYLEMLRAGMVTPYGEPYGGSDDDVGEPSASVEN